MTTAQEHLELLKDFKQSAIGKFIAEMVQKDKDYFTEEKTLEIVDFLKGTDWVFYGKRKSEPQTKNSGFYFAAFGANNQLMFVNSKLNVIYRVGKKFDIDDDIEKYEAEIQFEIEKENKKRRRFNREKSYWTQQIQTMTSDQIAETLAKLCMPDENDEDYDYDED